MFKKSTAVFLTVLAMSTASQVFAQDAAKTQLINEIIRLTGSSNAAEVIAQGEKEQLMQLVPPLLGKALEENKTLSQAQKQAAVPKLEKEALPRLARSVGSIFDSPAFKKEVASSQLAAYNKFFATNELQDIVNFLESPSGAKFVTNQPKVNETILEGLFKKYRPAAIKDLQGAIDREIKAIK